MFETPGWITYARVSPKGDLIAFLDHPVLQDLSGSSLCNRIQLGDRPGGLKEIEVGLRGINDFLNNIARTQGFNIGQFWDPNRDIRNAIQYNLEMISRESFSSQQLIANIERIALQMERETDLARRQESQSGGPWIDDLRFR